MKLETIKSLLEAQEGKQPVVAATTLSTGYTRLIDPEAAQDRQDLPGALIDAARDVLLRDKSGMVTIEGEEVFLNAFNPPLRLIIVGAVHIAQPLCQMAALAGYAVQIIDPREAFASDERFPGLTLDKRWPDEALEELSPDRRSAVVTLTHDPKLDDPALSSALNSPCFYIGALGSKKTHGARLERLRRQGFTEQDLGRIQGPVGLSIGAQTPSEIAIAIMAEITNVLRSGSVQ